MPQRFTKFCPGSVATDGPPCSLHGLRTPGIRTSSPEKTPHHVRDRICRRALAVRAVERPRQNRNVRVRKGGTERIEFSRLGPRVRLSMDQQHWRSNVRQPSVVKVDLAIASRVRQMQPGFAIERERRPQRATLRLWAIEGAFVAMKWR